MPQIDASCAWFQTRIDLASKSSFNHNPCFGLPGFSRRNQVWMRIARMHLDRKHLTCIEKFEEKWKATEARR